MMTGCDVDRSEDRTKMMIIRDADNDADNMVLITTTVTVMTKAMMTIKNERNAFLLNESYE